jgi:hypothetical protein
MEDPERGPTRDFVAKATPKLSSTRIAQFTTVVRSLQTNGDGTMAK